LAKTASLKTIALRALKDPKTGAATRLVALRAAKPYLDVEDYQHRLRQLFDWPLQDFAHHALPMFDYAEVSEVSLVLLLWVHFVCVYRGHRFTAWCKPFEIW
jgi:hypothetical protein